MASFNSRLLLDRRFIFVVFATVFLTFAVFFYSSSNLPAPTYDWIPKPAFGQPSSAFTPPPKDPNDTDVVHLDYLSFRPQKSDKSKKIKFFWNIPYAASAGGQNRFRGPQPVPKKYDGVMEWSGKLGMCPRIQKIDEKQRNRDDVAGDDVPGLEADKTEDCLSLNVFAPIDAEAGDDLPVCVLFPGGGFHLPGRSNGGELAEKSIGKDGDKGVIVITSYYRNGIYGFLGGDEIEKDGDQNMGLRDQRAVLEWVQKYIRYFGGNPDHVVLMGASAGGAAALLQMTANGGDHSNLTPGTGETKLFHGVIAQSAAAPTFWNREQANYFWKNVALGVNCTDLSAECVRNSSVGDLYFQNYPMHFEGRDSPPHWMWAPSIEPEGGMWTEPSLTAILNGRYSKVPSIIGYTTDEGTDQVKKATDTLGEFKSYLKDHYPLLTDDDLDLLAKTYPGDKHWPDSGKYWDAVAKAQGDIRYSCAQHLASYAMAEHNPPDVKTWQYHWNVVAEWDVTNGYGTHHATTIGRVMSRPDNEISDYFVSFIKHLDPNVDRNPKTIHWVPLNLKDPKRLYFDKREDQSRLKITLESPDPDKIHRCEVVKSLLPHTQQ